MSVRRWAVLPWWALLGLAGCLVAPPVAELPLEPSLPTETTPTETPPPVSSTPPGSGGQMECKSTTCAREATFCGALPDGCGGTLNCGVCAAEQACIKEGPVTLCAAPERAPGTAWSRSWPGTSVSALATDSRANVVAMTHTLEGSAPLKLDPKGNQLWVRSGSSELLELSGLSVTPSGELLTWGWLHGASGPGGAIAYRFDATGQSPQLMSRCGDECSVGPFYEDASGHLLSSSRSSRHSSMSYGPPARGGWSFSRGWAEPYQDNPIGFHPAAFDADGAVLATGGTGGQGTFQGQSFGTDGSYSGVVMKLSREGQRLWSREFARAGISFFGALGSGSYVVAGSFKGSLTWEGGVLRADEPDRDMPFLLVLDAQGRISWAQTLPLQPEHVALSSSGRIAVAGEVSAPKTGDRHSLHLREYDLQGHLRWSHTWVPLEDSGEVVLHGLVWSEDAWVLGGASKGIVPFNSTALWVPRESQGFVLKLRPAP